MKHFILYFSVLLALLTTTNLQAQEYTGLDFARENANWWRHSVVQRDPWLVEELVNHAYVAKEDTMDGENVKVIESINYVFRKFRQTTLPGRVDTSSGHGLITYSTEDTVFLYNTVFNKFTPLYVFNIEEGDTFCLPVFDRSNLRSNPIANGDTCFCLVLDSIRIVPYDEVFLETYFVSSVTGEDDGNDYPWPVYNWCPSSVGDDVPTGQYTKLTGGLYGFLPNRNNPHINNRPTSIDTLHREVKGGLVCYQDDSFDIHISHSNIMVGCYFDVALNMNNLSVEGDQIRVYPNPAKDHITIEVNKPLSFPATMTISDITGRILQKTLLNNNLQKQRIELDPLPIGQYILQITNEQNRWNQKLIIQQ